MIRKRVAITIFAASVFAAGCSSSDDDSGLPSNDDLAGIEAPEAFDDDTSDDSADDLAGTTEADGGLPVETPGEPTPVPDGSDGSIDTTTETDETGAVPVDPDVPATPGAPGADAGEDLSGDDLTGDDLTGTGDGVETGTVEGDTETGDTETGDTVEEGVVDEGTVPPPPGVPGTDDDGTASVEGDPTGDTMDTDMDTDTETTETTEGDEQPLTAALGELDGNPEGSRAMVTRQLLDSTEFGASLDGSDEPFTMFVPTDAAFISLGMSLEQLLDDPDLANTVQFHIVQGEALDRATLDARSGQELTMSNGQSNPLSQNGESLQIGSATIADAPGGGRVNNGVFYLVDQVLIPATGE